MPVYFGLPLNINEIMRLLNITPHKPEQVAKEYTNSTKYTEYNESEYAEYFKYDDQYAKYLTVKSYLKNKSNIDIFSTDKGQYILGYTIDEIRDVWNNFTNVDELIEILNKLKNDFEKDINILNIDLFHVELERMENNPVYVNCPKPFIMEWES
jgi:hypothetical protein